MRSAVELRLCCLKKGHVLKYADNSVTLALSVGVHPMPPFQTHPCRLSVRVLFILKLIHFWLQLHPWSSGEHSKPSSISYSYVLSNLGFVLELFFSVEKLVRPGAEADRVEDV